MIILLTRASNNQPVSLTKQIVSSGEGQVWETNQPGYLAKIYHDPTPERIEKLKVMLANPPIDPMLKYNHVSIAWVSDLLKDSSGKYLGFLMPAIKDSKQLSSIYNPSRRKKVAPGFNWYYLHVTALNTAWIIQEIHAKGYVLGDIKTENILVNDRALVAVIDTDSFQVPDSQTGKIYRCTVGSEGFTPVELLGKDIATTNQTEIHDRFRLAVLIHYLLFGYHPFSGQWIGSGESPEQTELIRKGYWYAGQNSLIRPSQNTIPLEVVHPEVKKLLLQCFNEGHTQPQLRPTAQDWHNALQLAVNELTVCGRVDSHHYSRHYRKCCWCERANQLGVDIFPGVTGTATIPSKATQSIQSRQSSNQTVIQSTSRYLNQFPSQSKLSSNKKSTTTKISTKQSSVQSSNSRLLNKQNFANTNTFLYKRRKVLKIFGISSLVLGTGTLTYNAYHWLNPIIVYSPTKKKSRYRTINEAIKTAEPNSIIQVPPGVYHEGLIIDKPVEIIGDGFKEEIIIESVDTNGILMQTNSAAIRNLTIKSKAGHNGKEFFGINISQGKLIVEDCNIISDYLSCVIIHGHEANPIIRKCRIYDNKQNGVFVFNNGKGTIEDCDIYGNAYSGVEIKTGADPIIRKCRIYDNKQNGVFVHEKGKGTVEYCDIYSNADLAVKITKGGNPVIRRCLFEFEVITVNDRGEEIERKQNKAKYFIENLRRKNVSYDFLFNEFNKYEEEVVALEMVAIPGGTFLMGSPESEKDRDKDESPQHQVTMPAFFISKYRVTELEWGLVASLPKVNKDLNQTSSKYNSTITLVSWYDAIEFCARLSNHTGKKYRLPSEAEWEYACRAGTTTPFHFGETITGDLASYDDDYTYAREPKGKKGKRPILKVANNFGLYGMHGGSWEWCADDWHENYLGAPTDGSAWLSGANSNNRKVLRGGSSNSHPSTCRSAHRNFDIPSKRFTDVGFRVVCTGDI